MERQLPRTNMGTLDFGKESKVMDGPTIDRLPPFSTIGYRERVNILQSLKRPLSGYLGGGTPRGGYWTDRLEEEWCNVFNCHYATPCNSATSGLLASCIAAGVGYGDAVFTTSYSMSATAACAMVLGARVRFIDIEPQRYSINLNMLDAAYKQYGKPKAVIVANLFGHPAYLSVLRMWCDSLGTIMIEDNAQSILAKEGDKYAGTVGHMGVFSLNVHKHLQCGEGGVVVTRDGSLSCRLRGAINHGELQGATPPIVGLNLRMTEPTAAIACAQLGKIDEIVSGRRELARKLTGMLSKRVKPPIIGHNCSHSFYVWAGTVADERRRRKFIHELNLRGFPLRDGYVRPLNLLFGHKEECPEAERVNNSIVTFEVCAYDPRAHHLKKMQDIVDYVDDAMERNDAFTEKAAQERTGAHSARATPGHT